MRFTKIALIFYLCSPSENYMIAARDIEVTFGSFTLMRDVSFLINSQERVGLAGRNGAGKTTLLRILAGEQKPYSGLVERPAGVNIGYLPQQMKVSDNTTLLNETLTAFGELMAIERERDLCREQLASRSDYESEEYLALCEKLPLLEERYNMLGGGSYVGEAEQALTGLGFRRSQFDAPTAKLSGGWRMRVELAKVLLSKPDILLLDEPTNHLDIESIKWLEDYLAAYQGALIMVTHDKAFLDNITTRTLEITSGRLEDYRVPYSKYLQLRQERREHVMAAYKNQKKAIDDTERFIDRFRYKATKAAQVQSRIKQLEKLEITEPEEEDSSSIVIRFAPAPRSGRVVIEADNLTKAYGDNIVLDKASIVIERGEKVALVGRNGEGKTTFARIVTGEIPFKGDLRLGHNVKTGYFAQNQDELLDGEKRVFDTIDELATGEMRTRTADLLGAFLFSGDETEKKVKVLSGGERSRLALIKLLLQPYNLLLMDEPTNHLDIRSKEILKQALVKYDGTVLIISHDRDFLDGLVTKVYEFTGKRIKEHIGGIYDFVNRKKEEAAKLSNPALSVNRGVSDREGAAVADSSDASSTKKRGSELREERKEHRRRVNRAAREVERREEAIAKLERYVEEMNREIEERSENLEDSFFRRYEEVKGQLEKEMSEWEKAAAELENAQQQE